MALTKKRLVAIMFVLTIAFLVLLLYLPESVTGQRDENFLLYGSKLMFLAVTAAIGTIFILILFFRKEYVRAQINTFQRFKYYLALLVKRDFVTKYRKSILGVLWSFLNPLLIMLVMTIVFSYLFRFEIEFFPAYLLSGMLIYNFFNESTTLAMSSIIINEGVIKKIYVPKYMFPLARVLSSLVNVLFSLVAFLIVFFVVGVPFNWTLFLIPIPIFYTFVFSMGVAMLMSSLAVFFRDLTYLYGIFTLLLMYLTPLFWPVSMLDPDGILVNIIGLNPIFQYVLYFRNLALWGTIPDLWANMVCIGYALLAFCGGTAVFMRQQDRYLLSL